MSRSLIPMSRPLIVGVLLVVMAGAVGAIVWRSIAGPPVMVRTGTGPQVCLRCVESALPSSFSLRAGRVSRSYRVTRDAEVLVRFEGGSVVLAGTPLPAGCHVLPVAEDAQIDFVDVRELLVRWPTSAGDCED